MESVKDRVEAIVRGIEVGYQCQAKLDFGAMYHQVYNHPELTDEFMDFMTENTNLTVVECKEAMTGEDFGYMLKEIPGFMFWLGAGSEFGLHHAKIMPDEAAIERAIDGIVKYVKFKGLCRKDNTLHLD